jgi:hypothetical protein
MTGAVLGNTSSPYFWAAWSLALVWQNYAFTRVSRARNSGSLKAHALAALQSNGVWFIQSLFVYSAFMNILTVKAGWAKAIAAALYYTLFTMAGSIYAHYVSLKKEKGASAVGANKKYAQIPVEEYEALRLFTSQTDVRVNETNARIEKLSDLLAGAPTKADFERVRDLAGQAYDITVGLIPDSHIKAVKLGDQVVTTGLPNS